MTDDTLYTYAVCMYTQFVCIQVTNILNLDSQRELEKIESREVKSKMSVGSPAKCIGRARFVFLIWNFLDGS